MPNTNHIRSVQSHQIVQERNLLRETRRPFQQGIDWLRKRDSMAGALCFGAAVAGYFPSTTDLMLVASGLATWWAMRVPESAPMKLPIQSGIPDVNDARPGAKPKPGAGIFHFANDMANDKQLWLTNDDCRRHFLVLGTTGAGKALPLDAPVHTPSGWRRLGDVHVGDMVTAADGRAARVDGVFPQGVLDMHEVTFEDGRSCEVCPDHLWEVFGVPGVTGARLLTTEEVRRAMAEGVSGLSVRLPDPVEKPATRPNRDPYVVGRELGATARVPVTAGADVRDRHVDRAVADDARILPDYGQGSLSQRWALVQGLSEACGTRVGATVVLSLDSRALADDVADVVRSLGGIAKVVPGRLGVSAWAVRVSHPTPWSFLPGPDDGDASETVLRLGFRSVAFTRRAPAACIRIDHPTHLFVTRDYVVTHNTETLLGFAMNALTWSSGFLFCDGKGDVSLWAKVFALARRFGREDDILVLNMMTGNADVSAGGGSLISNTLNPFATGSADGLVQLVVSLMDDVGGDGAMWKGRATAMFTGVMRAMTFLREAGLLDLNVGEIRNHLNLRKIIDLCDKDAYPDMPESIRISVRSYLTSLPGFQEEKKYKQAQTTLDQHGYLEMQFTKILGSLADTYGHVFKTPYGEIDMQDVVLNRRILVIMLPALEKSGDELANLGKIVVATLKGMMGASLGNKVEGDWESIVDLRVTNSPSPFLCVLDEVGYYTVEGLALMAAQARSLGFSMIYASQDIPAMRRINEKEADSIIANTNIKIYMKIEDVANTGEHVIKQAGKVKRGQMGGMSGQVNGLVNSYTDDLSATMVEQDTINPLDLKALKEGQMFVVWEDRTIPANSIYANPASALDTGMLVIRPNHFVKIKLPSRDSQERADTMTAVLDALMNRERCKKNVDAAAARLASVGPRAAAGDEIAVVASVLGGLDDRQRGQAKDASCVALQSLVQAEAEAGRRLGAKIRSAGSVLQEMDDRDVAHARGIVQEGRTGGIAELRSPQGAFDDEGLDARNYRDGGPPDFVDEDPLAGLDDFTDPVGPSGHDAMPVPPRGPRRPTPIRPVEHEVRLNEQPLLRPDKLDSNDAVLRMLADLDYNPVTTTAEEVERRLEECTGAAAGADAVAEPDFIDSTAVHADGASDLIATPVAESAPMPQDDVMSDIFAQLLDDEGGNG